MGMMNRSVGALLGFAVGDALGDQFVGIDDPGDLPIVATRLRGQANTHQLVLAAHALCGGALSPEAVASRFADALRDWYHTPGLLAEHPSHTTVAAAGQLVAGAPEVAVANADSDGADPLMRVLPAGICYPPDQVGAVARALAGLTHGHPEALAATTVYGHLVSRLIRGAHLGPALVAEAAALAAGTEVERMLGLVAESTAAGVQLAPGLDVARAGGALSQAVAIALHHGPARDWRAFEAAEDEAIRVGPRGDTVGALAGGLLGAAWGSGGVSRHLIERLARHDELVELARALFLRSQGRELTEGPDEAERDGGFTSSVPLPGAPPPDGVEAVDRLASEVSSARIDRPRHLPPRARPDEATPLPERRLWIGPNRERHLPFHKKPRDE